MVAKDPVDKLTHALCGLGRPFEIFNSKRKLFYYHLVTPQCRTHGVILLCAQRTTMPHSPPSDRCDQLIFRGNLIESCICLRERELQTLNELKQAKIASAVTRGLNPDVPMKDSGIPWIGMIPAHWEINRNKVFLREKKSIVGSRTDFPLLSLTKEGVILRDVESGKGKFPKDHIRSGTYISSGARHSRGRGHPRGCPRDTSGEGCTASSPSG